MEAIIPVPDEGSRGPLISSDEMNTSLDKPAHKFFLADLVSAKNISPNSPTDAISALKVWESNCCGTVTFSIVWVQGVITKVLTDDIYLDDGTAVAVVKGYSKIPFCSVKPSKGQYVMVIGQLSCGGQCPAIRVVKLQDLSHQVDMETMWSLEVVDQIQQNM